MPFRRVLMPLFLGLLDVRSKNTYILLKRFDMKWNNRHKDLVKGLLWPIVSNAEGGTMGNRMERRMSLRGSASGGVGAVTPEQNPRVPNATEASAYVININTLCRSQVNSLEPHCPSESEARTDRSVAFVVSGGRSIRRY